MFDLLTAYFCCILRKMIVRVYDGVKIAMQKEAEAEARKRAAAAQFSLARRAATNLRRFTTAPAKQLDEEAAIPAVRRRPKSKTMDAGTRPSKLRAMSASWISRPQGEPMLQQLEPGGHSTGINVTPSIVIHELAQSAEHTPARTPTPTAVNATEEGEQQLMESPKPIYKQLADSHSLHSTETANPNLGRQLEPVPAQTPPVATLLSPGFVVQSPAGMEGTGTTGRFPRFGGNEVVNRPNQPRKLTWNDAVRRKLYISW